MEKKYSLQLAGYIKEKNWTAVSGYIFFIGLMAAGYAYNLTFVQLGLVDLGKRVVGLSDSQVAAQMALLAFVTCMAALLSGYFMKRHERVSRLSGKLRLVAAVVAAQAILTGIIPLVQTRGAFAAWVFFTSLVLGVGVPATFSLAVDLVPVRDRGLAAALITSLAYLGAAVLFPQWSIEKFRTIFLWPMVAGAAVLGVAAFKSNPVVAALSQQYASPEFGRGRFVRKACGQIDRRFIGIVVLMFGIYFIDSLGFLRIIRTPIYLNTAWQSPEADMRLFIGITHVAGAAIAGIFYSVLRTRSLFLWVFGIFSLVHLLYAFHARFTPGSGATVLMTMLYAIAVSFYTVINFALWADLSTPQTISRNAALGVALSGWTATFFSTALALRWQEKGVPLVAHLNWVNAFAMLFFLGMLVLLYLKKDESKQPRSLEV